MKDMESRTVRTRMKKENINVRLGPKMKTEAERKAKLLDMSLSDYIRDLIQQDIRKAP